MLLKKLLLNHGDQIVSVEYLEFFAIELDLGSAILADEDAVANFDFERRLLAVVIGFASPERANDAFSGLFFRGIGDDNPALLCFLLFGGFYENSIAKRL